MSVAWAGTTAGEQSGARHVNYFYSLQRFLCVTTVTLNPASR